eukprot:6212391-Pleurochrysis_carterae.AAC.1
MDPTLSPSGQSLLSVRAVVSPCACACTPVCVCVCTLRVSASLYAGGARAAVRGRRCAGAYARARARCAIACAAAPIGWTLDRGLHHDLVRSRRVQYTERSRTICALSI